MKKYFYSALAGAYLLSNTGCITSSNHKNLENKCNQNLERSDEKREEGKNQETLCWPGRIGRGFLIIGLPGFGAWLHYKYEGPKDEERKNN